MSEENHMGWKLVRGVRRDVINLFKLFGETNSVRFEDFSKIWKELKFSLIFNNRLNIIELLEFTEELLQIVKEYLSPVYEFNTRVAALYSLYGLYFKQPIRGGAKIRLIKTEWDELCSLVENSKQAKHYDVAFIFIKLHINGAFSFVATIRPAGLERGYRKYSEKRNTLLSKTCDVELLYRPLISSKLLNAFIKLESLYCKKKSELLGEKNLVFIDGKFAESLQQELKDYASEFQTQPSIKSKNVVSIEDNNSDINSEGSKKGEERSKTSNRTIKAARSSKQNDDDEVDDEVPTKRRRPGRKYLELLAKKKAEFYIQKLQQEKSSNECSEPRLGLMELLD